MDWGGLTRVYCNAALYKRGAMVKPSLPHHSPSVRNDGTDRSTLPIHGTISIGTTDLSAEGLSLLEQEKNRFR